MAFAGTWGEDGRAALPHWRAQVALSRYMLREHELRPNIGIGLAAALLDLGCTPTQAGAMSTFLHQQDFAANAVEAAQQRRPRCGGCRTSASPTSGPRPRDRPAGRAGQRRPEPAELVYTDDGLVDAPAAT